MAFSAPIGTEERRRLWHPRGTLCAVCRQPTRGFGWFDPHRSRRPRKRPTPPSVDELAQAGLTLFGAYGATEVLGGHDGGGVDAPEIRELHAALLEDGLAGLPVGLDDVARLPFTVKTDLRDTYPFGLFARPVGELARLHPFGAKEADRRHATGPSPLFGFFAASGIEFDLTILAGLLSVMGFSINDKIVVFDRVRENFRNLRAEPMEILNRSINQTLSRTIITSFVAFLTVFALYLYGGGSLEGMALSQMIGIVLGTISSIFVACPLLTIGFLTVTKQDLMPKAKDEALLARRP
mgnify:CR=1 FL=1